MTPDNSQNIDLAKTYNELPYTSYVFAHCQPTRLHAIAKIKGLNPPPLHNAKILEIGCSYGGNLFPFAIQHPNSQLIGIDLSEKQIEIGKQMLTQIGVQNVHLISADICQVNFDFKFDYIICHGVFSWIPKFVQDAILQCIQKYLSENGVAFVSYNTYPGWKIKDIAKDLMLFSSNMNLDRYSRIEQSLEALKFTNKIIQRRNPILSPLINNLFNTIQSHSKYYIAHEYFENHNNPMYFKEFIDEIEKHQLSYLSDSNTPTIYNHLLFENNEWDNICRYFDNNLENIEQFIDFTNNREFRCSIITHTKNLQKHNINNNITQYKVVNNINNLYIKIYPTYTPASEEKPAYWKIAKDHLDFYSNEVTDAIFNYLSKYPDPIRVKELTNEVLKNKKIDQAELNAILWNIIHSPSTYLCFEQHKLSHFGEKPYLSKPYQKLIEFVRNNANITNLSNFCYQNITLDFLATYIAPYLDGTRTIHELANIVRQGLNSQEILFNRNDETLTSEQISDEDILEKINEILNQLYCHGYFNHYT